MKLAIHGTGKMGEAVEKVARERGHIVTARFNSKSPIAAASLEEVEAVIDFSNVSTFERAVDAACTAGVNLVIGTTGWNARMSEIRLKCESGAIGVVHASNFSPGANIMFALAKEASRRFASVGGYDAAIEERHHAKKVDAPSGTAIRIGEAVREGSGKAFDPPIASSRSGAEFGLHTLFFDSPDDLVEISHCARGRDGFARGAILAAELVKGKKGFFSFSELIGI